MTKGDDMQIDPSDNQTITKLKANFEILSNPPSKQQYEDALYSIQNTLSGNAFVNLVASSELRPFLYHGFDPKAPEEVKRLTISQILRCVENPSTVSILEDPKIRSLVFDAMKTKETGISGIATQLLAKSALSDTGLHLIFKDSREQIQDLLSNSNETIRFRALDLIASSASSRYEAFKLLESNGLLHSIIKSFDPQDILQTLNFVELYDKLVSIPEGILYLEENKVFSNLVTMINSEDSLSSFLQPRVIRFFGSLSTRGETGLAVLEKNHFVQILNKMLEEASKETKDAIITAIGYIGGTEKGLLSVNSSGIWNEYTYHLFREDDLRIVSLHSLGHLLSSISKQNVSASTLELLKKLVMEFPSRFGGNTNIIDVAMPLLKTPFPDLRNGSFDVLNGLSSHVWGVQLLMNYPGYFEFITNRTTETTKPGKEWKWTIIQTTVKTAARDHSALDIGRFKELELYVKLGAFYQKAENQVEVGEKAE